MFNLSVIAVAACLIMAGCGKSPDPAASLDKAQFSNGPQPSSAPVALVPDGSAANTGNLVNGQQARPTPAGK